MAPKLLALGQKLLGLDDSEQKLIKVVFSRTPKGTGTTVTFVANMPAERASNLRVNTTTEEITEGFKSLGMVTVSGGTVKRYLLLSDAPHQVVAVMVSTLPGGSEGAYAMPKVSTTTSMLRGTTTVASVEASGATGHSSLAFAIAALLCSTVIVILA
jgi:hypothetical protein